MQTPARLVITAWLTLFVSFVACREAPEEPRGTPAATVQAPAPAATTTAAPDPAARPTTTMPIRPDLLRRPLLRPPALLRGPDSTAIGPAEPASSSCPGATTSASTPADDPTATPPRRESPVRRVEVHAIDAAEGEDGRGNVVPAVHPVAIDLHADAWTGRGLDPVLVIGDLVFRHYDHPGPGVLRFVAADADTLPVGQPVWLRYGDRERFQLAPTLEVPR